MARTAWKKNQNVELIVEVTQWDKNCAFGCLTLMFARTTKNCAQMRAAGVPVRTCSTIIASENQ